MRFQPGAQVHIPPIDTISHDPSKGNPCFPQALDHLSGQFTFGVKTNRLGNARFSAPPSIVDPVLGKREFAVDEGMSFCGYIAEKNAHLTVLHLSGRPAILLCAPLPTSSLAWENWFRR